VIECKFLASLHIDAWVYGYDGKLPGIWDKPLREAETHHKMPLIIAKQNKKPALILTHQRGLEVLQAAADYRIKVLCRFSRNGLLVAVVFLQDVLVKVKWVDLQRILIRDGLLTKSVIKRERF